MSLKEETVLRNQRNLRAIAFKFTFNKKIDDALKQPLGLTDKEKKDIIAFLKTLTDKAFLKKK